MNIDKAVELVVKETGNYPISAFEYDGTCYVLVTPLPDYDPENDVAQCYVPVTDGRIGEPQSVPDLFVYAENADELFDAAQHSETYLRRNSK